MSVELKITRGSNRGTTAPIHPGYYLVGRHKDCQIRPKSRSVSRRHCLLLRNDDGFGALDLKSTRGTYVNGVRIKPREWRVLRDGDEIHFGKVAFTVAIHEPALATSVESGDSSAVTPDPIDSPSETTPESFKSFDVAQFLEEEDAAEFESEYGVRPEMGVDGDTDIGRGRSNLGDFHDTPVEIDETADEPLASVNLDVGDDQVAGEVQVDPAPNQRPPRRSIDHSQYKRKPKRSIKLPSFGPPNWKMIGAIALVVGTSGLVVWQAYRLNRGQTVQVREGLD
ncbi:MAG: FHA domain-containing protein [Planctomycetota bacterium]